VDGYTLIVGKKEIMKINVSEEDVMDGRGRKVL